MASLPIAGVGALIGAGVCAWLARTAIHRPHEALIRTNIDGRPVPAVLGYALVGGSLTGLLIASWVARGLDEPVRGTLAFGSLFDTGTVGLATGVVLVGFYLAGSWDDRRGDERPRGFRGHLESLRSGRLTGGLVKLTGGGLVALGAAVIMRVGVFPWGTVALSAVAIALTANLLNLFDRAPGRAGKVFLLMALPMAALGDDAWLVAAAGTTGALLAALPFDLRARAMLGDAGSNPLGAVLGVGFAFNLGGSLAVLGALVVVLLALTLASERWSFSEVIARNRWLARLDHLGRK